MVQSKQPPEWSIYKIAQSGTYYNYSCSNQPRIKVYGRGIKLNNVNALKVRAKRKSVSNTLKWALVDIAKEQGNRKKEQSYLNSIFCQYKLIHNNGRLYVNFCKNRFCITCLNIRKAVIVNKYLPIVQKWSDPHFVTLTIKAVKKEKLHKMLNRVLRKFRQIKDKYKKKYQRGLSIKMIGLKFLECGFNISTNTFNPHLHLIVPDKQTANIFIKEWHSKWGDEFVNLKAIHSKKIIKKEHDLIKVIKYGCKFFTKLDFNKIVQGEQDLKVFAAAMDTILDAMKNRRLYDRFGFNLPKNNNSNRAKVQLIDEYENFVFDDAVIDWINEDTGESIIDLILNI